jgi:membrane fusion protein (multidrug efflux system)
MATMMDQAAEPQPRNDAVTLDREQDEPTNGNSRKKVIIPIVAVLVLAALVWGVKEYLYARAHESTDNAQVDGHVIPVLAKVGGYITTLTVQENDSVKADEVLARIDDSEYKVKVAQAQADLAAARAAAGTQGRSGQAQAMVATAEGQHDALDAQIVAARADQEKAQSDLARMQELVAKQIVSKQQLDAAAAAAAAATANLEAVQRQAAAGGASVRNAEAGVRVAQARLEAAQAALENAQLQLGYTTVVSPVTGVVSRKLIEVGQLVQPGQALMSIVSDTGVWITANYKETQLASMRVGQPVEIDVDAYPGCQAEGRVESLSAATGARFALLPPDNATGNFTKVVQRVPVRIEITKGCGVGRPLRQGLSVTTHVRTAAGK